MANGDHGGQRDSKWNGIATDGGRLDSSAMCYELCEGSRCRQLPLPSPYPIVPPSAQTMFKSSTGLQEHLMMIPINHVGGVQFILKPPNMPRARGKVKGRCKCCG